MSPEPPPMEKLRLALSRSYRALRLFLASDVGVNALGWSGLLVAMLVAFNALNVVNSYVGRDFMTAVAAHRPRQYATYALLYVGVFAGSTIVGVMNRFSEERLRLLWRAWMTRSLIDGYLSRHAYFRLKAREEIDNPDQRISEDVKSYTQTTLSFVILSLNASITSLAFLGVLWSITPRLVFAAIAYAAFGTTMAILLGRPLVWLNNLQLKKEADLRYHLIQVREAAEMIAPLGIEKAVRARLRDRLDDVVKNTRSIIAVTRNLGFFTIGYKYMIQLIPLLIVAPLYLRGEVEFGVVTQSAMAFTQVLDAFSLIVTQFETLSTFAAVTDRLSTIVGAIEQARAPSESRIEVVEEDDRVAYERLTLWTPKERRPLLIDLELALTHGGSLLISGPNAAAKDALFLATARIWEEGEGRIIRPHRNRIAFVPQRPYAVHGTLRERLVIAIDESKFDDEQLIDVVRKVGLEEALRRIGGLDVEHDWANTLSDGEQHLVSVARILLAPPRFAFLDQIAEDLAPDQVGHLYRVLAEASIAYLSIGEDHHLMAYHERILEIHNDGRWQLTAAAEAADA